MSLFANFAKIGFVGICDSVSAELLEVGKKDKITRNLVNQLVKEENALLDHLSAIIKQDPDFDEEPFKKLADGLVARRALLVQMIEDQMKSIQSVYDKLDNKMTHFDSCVKRMAPSMQTLGGESDDARKKKKRKANQETSSLELEKQQFEQLMASAVVDPSEPLYCFCRRISCGEMVGCDNEDCALEWFHYSCVGLLLSQEVPETWYCPDCRSTVSGAV